MPTGEMIVGTPSHIAIECGDLWRDDNERLFGKIRLIVKNTPIGNFEQNVLIDAVVFWLKDFANFDRPRFHESLLGKGDEDCLNTVMSALYGDGVADPIRAELYKHMEFCPKISPSFDGDKAILVDYEHSSKLIYQPFLCGFVSSITLPRGELNHLITQFIKAL